MLIPMSKERFVFRMLSDARARERKRTEEERFPEWIMHDYIGEVLTRKYRRSKSGRHRREEE